MPQITQKNISNASTADLQARLNELKGMTRRTLTPDELESKKLRAGAEVGMKYKPEVATRWIQDASALEAKKDIAQEKAVNQAIAKQQYDQAFEAWSKNKDGVAEQIAMSAALSQAKLAGLSLVDPVTNYVKEKQFGQNLELDVKKQAMQEAMNAASNRRDEQRLKNEQQRLDLERQRIANDLAKTSGGKLNSTSIDQYSKFASALQSVDGVISAFEDMQNASGLSDMYAATRDMKGSAALAKENFGRIQSGGAIQADELKSFKSMIEPGLIDYVDGGAAYYNNIKKVKDYIVTSMTNIANEGKNITGGTPTPQTSQPAAKQPTAIGKLQRR